MEVPIISRISDFEAGINSLHNPSFLSRLSSLSGIGNIPQAYSFWKWGALILALVATFSGVINRIKVLIIRYGRKDKSPSSEPLLIHLEDDNYSDEDDETSSYSSEDEEEDDATSQVDEDFRVAGSDQFEENHWQNCKLKLRRRSSSGDRFSWSEFANGKSVVKLWDGLGLGLDLNNSAGNIISIHDLNRDQKISSLCGGNYQIPAVTVASPAVVLSAWTDNATNVAVRVWDPRVGRQIPAIFSEWRPQRGKIVGINSGGVEKVYVRDDVTGELMVGDMRNANSPLENITESDGDTWWDADAVMVSDECFDESAVNCRESVVSRCRDAVRSYLF